MQLVLDGVVEYLPAPTEVNPQDLTDEEGNPTGQYAIVDPNETFKAWHSKSWTTVSVLLTYVRIYSGRIAKRRHHFK